MSVPARRPDRSPPFAWRLAVRAVLGLLRGVFGWRIRPVRPEVVPPPDQPLVVVINHTSNVDAFVVADTIWRRMRHWCRPLVKAELFNAPVLGALVRSGGSIQVIRTDDSGRVAAYADAVARLRGGDTVLIAPEGTITHDGSLLPLRHGAARLAIEAGVDVLVATHFGAQRGFSPVAKLPQRGAVVTMAFDVITPEPDEDASSLTGRIAATMLDRSAQLAATYPQPDHDAPWWPPYSSPASPSATARENLERYRASMAEAIAQGRERMSRLAEEHEVEERVAHARERVIEVAEELAERSRERRGEFADEARRQMEEFADEARRLMEEFASQAREHATALGDRLPTRDQSASAEDDPADDGTDPGADPAHEPDDRA